MNPGENKNLKVCDRDIYNFIFFGHFSMYKEVPFVFK